METKKVMLNISDMEEIQNYELYFKFNQITITDQTQMSNNYVLIEYIDESF